MFLLLTNSTTVLLECSYSEIQMCRCCNSVPLEFERHCSHLAKQTKQTKGSRLQINHFRHASMQPEGNFSESLYANALHYSWRSSASLSNQTRALWKFLLPRKNYWDSFPMKCSKTIWLASDISVIAVIPSLSSDVTSSPHPCSIKIMVKKTKFSIWISNVAWIYQTIKRNIPTMD